MSIKKNIHLNRELKLRMLREFLRRDILVSEYDIFWINEEINDNIDNFLLNDGNTRMNCLTAFHFTAYFKLKLMHFWN